MAKKKQLWESEVTSYVLQLSTRTIHLKLMELMEQIVAILIVYLHWYPGFKVLMPDRSWELPCTAEVLTSWMFVESAFDLQVWSWAKDCQSPFLDCTRQLLLVEPTTHLFGKIQDIRKIIDLIRLEHIVSVFFCSKLLFGLSSVALCNQLSTIKPQNYKTKLMSQIEPKAQQFVFLQGEL